MTRNHPDTGVVTRLRVLERSGQDAFAVLIVALVVVQFDLAGRDDPSVPIVPSTSTVAPTAIALPSSSISVAAETCTVVPETNQSPIGAGLGRLSMTRRNWSSSERSPHLHGRVVYRPLPQHGPA
jgi:hypothetical protein